MRTSLVSILFKLKGNQRACVFTEPLWGMSVNLCLPYASIFMLVLGIRDSGIGLIMSLGLLTQVGTGILSGLITDKYGRRRTATIFDLAAWSVPCFLWFIASFMTGRATFYLFVTASIINAVRQIAENAWDCLLVEGAERELIPKVYSLIQTASNLSVLIAPVAAVLIAKTSIIIAMRILYLNGCVLMTTKTILVYVLSHETAIGRRKMEESKKTNLGVLLSGYVRVIKQARQSKATMYALTLTAIGSAIAVIPDTFWPILVTQKLMVPISFIPFFPMARSLLGILFYLTIIHRVSGTQSFRTPLLLSLGIYLLGQGLVAAIPAPLGSVPGQGVYVALVVCVVADSFGVSMLAMLTEALIALVVDSEERSRIMALQRTAVMIFVAPFGWFGGMLSNLSRSLPFCLTSVLIMIMIGLTLWYYRHEPDKELKAAA